jgi:hypothetical protein
MADEDDLWLNALAGQTQPDEHSTLSTQAAALRAAIRARTVTEAEAVRGSDPAREAALIARARAAGVLPRRRTLRWAALAAALACVVAGLSLQLRTRTDTLVLRGDSAAVVHLRSRDPLHLKQDLLHELNAVGVQATGYETLGRQGIDAEVPAPLPASVRKVLEQHAIPVPAGTVLQVEIESDSGP